MLMIGAKYDALLHRVIVMVLGWIWNWGVYGWRLQFYRPKAIGWVRWDKFMHTVHVLVLFQNRNLDCIESLLLKFFNHYDDLWCLYRIPISWPKITPTRLCIDTKGLDQRTYQTSILHQPLFTSPIYRE